MGPNRIATSCVYCSEKLYILNDGMVKCAKCRRKYSPRRAEKILTLIAAFAHDETAVETAERLGLSYVSVHRFFGTFRRLCARICEEEYEARRHIPCEYEEYFYLERAKRQRSNAVFDAQNFLTFDYGGHLYTIVMPSLQRYRQQFIEDELEPVYATEFARFKRQSRLIKVSSRHNNIVRFWDYFEKSILRYKGVRNESFPLYLKEMELKFNHSVSERETLLTEYYFKENA
jgi:transposase